MKITLLIASMLVALSTAVPLLSRQATPSTTITIKTGDGDSATTLSVPHDTITTTSGLSSAAVAASISDTGVFCQAFTDAAATVPVGSVFTAQSAASFSATSSGGTASQLSDAVPIGSYLCSSTAAGVAAKVEAQDTLPKFTTEPFAGSVRIRFEKSADNFVQGFVPLNRPFLTHAVGSPFGAAGLSFSIKSVTPSIDVHRVKCQAYQDARASVPVGNPATAQAHAVLSRDRNVPAGLKAIVCVA